MIENMKEKKSVALLSVFAAVFLTCSKIIIGVMTGSLGIISEALHSGLDLVAAIVTYFSVRVSDTPPDKEHNYGHGKVENLSALIETILLLVTCFWIVYEAVHRLWIGKALMHVTHWSYVVISLSVFIDFWRSRALMKAAKKHNSQALEADALHFSTDIWSSLVVLLGLICVDFNLFFADAIAALIVAVIVIYVSYKLGKRSIDVLLDKAPKDVVDTVERILEEESRITHYHDLRIRTSGADVFVDMCIHVDPQLSINEAHKISEDIEKSICKKICRCTVQIHEEPEETALK